MISAARIGLGISSVALLSACGGGGGGSGSSFGPAIEARFGPPTPLVAEPGTGASAAAWETSEYWQSNGLALVNAAEGYAARTMGTPAGGGVRVGVMDDGIDFTNPEFAPREVHDFVTYRLWSGARSTEGHGTHVAGIIGARRDGYGIHGLSYNATLVDLKIATYDPVTDDWGSNSFASDVSAALLSAAGINDTVPLYTNGGRFEGEKRSKPSAQVDVVNMSFTGPNPFRLRDNMERAANTGLIMVAALGNDEAVGPQAAPAINMDNLGGMGLAVAALDSTGTALSGRAGSNTCGTLHHCLAAPGEAILSTAPNTPSGAFGGPGYVYASGTSMAAPLVTAAVANAIAAFPGLSREDIVARILSTADDIGAPGVDDVFGHGRLNMGALMSPVGSLSMPVGQSVSGSAVPVAAVHAAGGPGAGAGLAAFDGTVMALDAEGAPFPMDLHTRVARHQRDTRSALDRFITPSTTAMRHVTLPGAAPGYLSIQVDNGTWDHDLGVDDRNAQRDDDSDAPLAMAGTLGVSDGIRLGFSSDMGPTSDLTGRHMALLGHGLVGTAQSDADPVPFGSEGDTLRLAQRVTDRTWVEYAYHRGSGLDDDSDVEAFLATLRQTRGALELAVRAGVTREDGAVLGSTYGGLASDLTTDTLSAAVDISWQANDRWILSGGYAMAHSTPDASGLMRFSAHRSDSVSVAAGLNDVLTSGDRMTLIAQLPFATLDGDATLSLPTARTESGAVQYTDTKVDLSAQAREQMLQAVYSREVGRRGGSLDLGAYYRWNADHVAGAEDVGAAVRWSLNF